MPVRGKKAPVDLHKILEEEIKSKEPINPEEIIFALDIGTRSIVGIVGVEESGIFKIIDIEVAEHKNRAMIGGQIHEISKVVEVVEYIKEKLESRLGFELKRVAIAAAGRSLKTSSAKVDRKFKNNVIITQDIVNSLELEGIQLAYENLYKEDSEQDDTAYYCVGHTIVNYYLNGYVLSDLVGHKGKEISANVLATFLPYTVVDSLYSVMQRVGLKVTSLTLEPIAAIDVAIPQDTRLLNLAMVDIGAGTSDIAITKDGTIIAYAMCSVAGDQITEKIAQHYLLDFNTAERVKIEGRKHETVEFKDIMGINFKVKADEINKVIEPAVEHLTDVIAKKIIEYNGKTPNAVFCIGGGSQTHGLAKSLAQRLGIPIERVGVRGADIIRNVKFTNKQYTGPDAITPVGIAVMAQTKRGYDFIQVKVNKKKIKLFNTGKVTIGDALAMSGVDPEELIPMCGKELTFELNRKRYTVKGGYGRAAELYINSKPANIHTLINNEDQIKVIPSTQGQPAKAYVEDFIEEYEIKKVIFNNDELDITTNFTLNGKLVRMSDEIREGDKLVINEINTIKDLANICEIDLDRFYVVANCCKVGENYVIKNGDNIKTVYKTEETAIGLEDELPSSELVLNNQKFQQTVNVTSEIRTGKEKRHRDSKKIITVNVNNNPVKLKGKGKYIFIDIFNHFKIDLADSKGRVVLKLNGVPASFTDNIREGDNIEIFWE